MSDLNNWILTLHRWKGEWLKPGEKSTATDDYTTVISLTEYQKHTVVYFDYVNAIDMYDCIKYTKLVGSLMVAYVDEESLPNVNVIRNHNHTVSYWKKLRAREATMAAIDNMSRKRRLIIYHPGQFPYLMFVYDTNYDRVSSSSDSDNEPPPSKCCRRQLPLTDFNFTRKVNKVSVGTQTSYAEMYSLNNRPVCTPRSLFARETHGVFNKTNALMSLPNMNQELPIPQFRLSPVRNMQAINNMLKKTDNTMFDTYDMYNLCHMCNTFFFTKTLNNICLTCAREHNKFIQTAEPFHYVIE
uniref:ORF004 n=1 Tax=Spodoptera frugiperda granulovirus TaxID=307454 RepID=A0A346QVS3_9BBAC|nr:ORF004 [Spodoptera frugiperda granulovirus]